jgi:hypothetical protein
VTKNEEAKNWLDRINWRLLEDDATTPPRAPLNQVNWHERQFIAGIRRGFRTMPLRAVVSDDNVQASIFDHQPMDEEAG